MERLTEGDKKKIIIKHGQNPDLPPIGVAEGTPPTGLRNWICEVDGHEDSDNTGLCIHCGHEIA